MRKRHTDSWQTVPQTTQELRYSCELDRENEDSDHSKYTRGKRRRKTLPNSWDDKPCGSWDLRKSWKEKRTKQYYGRCNLTKFTFEIMDTYPYEIENYLKDHNIPYRRIDIYGEPYVFVRTTERKFIKTGVKVVYHWKKLNPDGSRAIMFWMDDGYWTDVPLDKPEEYRMNRQIGTKFVYWAKKPLTFPQRQL